MTDLEVELDGAIYEAKQAEFLLGLARANLEQVSEACLPKEAAYANAGHAYLFADRAFFAALRRRDALSNQVSAVDEAAAVAAGKGQYWKWTPNGHDLVPVK